MISVWIPKEIKGYKEKFIAGLTVRQTISVVIAGIFCVPLYFWGSNFLPEEIIAWIVMIIALPCVCIGFFKVNGMVFEKYAVAVFKFSFLVPTKRKYKTSNFFRELQNEHTYTTESSKIKKLRTQESILKAYYLKKEEEGGILNHGLEK
jgi:membrane-bound ClpP family serine protease